VLTQITVVYKEQKNSLVSSNKSLPFGKK